MPPSSAPTRPRKPDVSAIVWYATIVAIGLNLRPLLTSISPLMTTIRAATGLSFSGASLLTSLPVVAMGLGAFGTGLLARRLGETRGVALGLIAIAAACGARAFAATGGALMLTAIAAGAGVAAIQALLPAVMKQRFAHRVPLAMGLFSASIMGGGGLGASLSPLAARLGGSWHIALAIWAAPSLMALVLWSWLNYGARATGSPAASQPGMHHVAVPVWKKRRAWALGLHFGLVNGGYTSLVAWLPAYYQQHGASVSASGSLLAAMTVFQAACALLLPLAAARFTDRRPWLIGGLCLQWIGVVGLAAWPEAAPLLWIAAAGAGLGGTFSVTLVTALDHSGDHHIAARLVAFVQGLGFVIAAIAPIVAGRVRDLTGGFTAAWVMLAISISAMIVLTLAFSPRSYGRWLGLHGSAALDA
ncbi:CP family cyanate transporter-like MFS transporter [Paraburkholderia bannensis]|uniref:CP family cyanate transporter-like MFS transporter n=1 Tax=Paraburkholderia bannensis TaxID=765414 RepID=A0A7W9TVA3_9BURK|nr:MULTISPECIES: cyanate transporter [Paraburkholderia]MBB3257123.1 CP family cyanate transporter-like MFS transporter [Paraburkholderia sp. WP4_3_2]MBB6102077.1 CP family cyanate transporter-like MFS transporter [Paraburkholderia bannensis]